MTGLFGFLATAACLLIAGTALRTAHDQTPRSRVTRKHLLTALVGVAAFLMLGSCSHVALNARPNHEQSEGDASVEKHLRTGRRTGTLPGATLRWVHVAEHEFRKHQIDVAKYYVTLFESDEIITVVLSEWSPDDPRRENRRGNMGDTLMGWSVRIRKANDKVILFAPTT